MIIRSLIISAVLVFTLIWVCSPLVAAEASEKPLVCRGIVVSLEGGVSADRDGAVQSIAEGFPSRHGSGNRRAGLRGRFSRNFRISSRWT